MKLLEEETTTIQPLLTDFSACTVLVVDDDEIVREQLAALLGEAGFDVRVAKTGAEALAIFDQEPCRIVLSDWEMPDMDGVALCRNIRGRRLQSYTYVLMHTVRRTKRDVVAGLTAGADDYVVKGAPPEELLARLAVGRRITGLEHTLRATNLENRRLAFTDSLTGAYNRRFLMKHLPREYERSRRHQHPLAALVCDLDHFKLVNDGYGHAAGDAVLIEVTRRMTDALRSSDWVVRAGGEEFVVVLPETDLDGALVVAEKIRAEIAAHPVAAGTVSVPITMSVGYSAVLTEEELDRYSFDELLRTADARLYDAKLDGRNRVKGSAVTRNGEKPDAAPTSKLKLQGAMSRAAKLQLLD
ncbi:MAG TPA: diguanylate cyclase [Steroidobacteraceae bacterium]|nr:diguanylate cyclase [Steroidobacteraceae bacterium]